MKPIDERKYQANKLTLKQINIKRMHRRNCLRRKRKGRFELLDRQIHRKTREEKKELNLQSQTNTQNERKKRVERSDKHAEREKRKN